MKEILPTFEKFFLGLKNKYQSIIESSTVTLINTKINKYFYNISFTIIGTLFLLFCITSIGFIFHIPVNCGYMIISAIVGLYYLKRLSDTNCDYFKQLLIIIIILLFAYKTSLFYWDASMDGRSYHLASVLLLKNGWNPIYDNINEVTEAAKMYLFDTQWGCWYVKFCEIIGANIYNLTNHIENTKIINLLMFFSTFMYVYSVINNVLGKKLFYKILISFIVVINPVCLCQILTNYIDINLYYAYTILIFTILKTEKEAILYKNDILILIFSSIIISNCKFTGSVYLIVILFCWFIYRLVNKNSIKKLFKLSTVITLILVITGINPYFTNLKNNGHPLHPIMGINKTDLIKDNMPIDFKYKKYFTRFIYGHFGETTNNVENLRGIKQPVHLKIPFSKHKNESIFDIPDMRTGGFGYFWSGILVLTLIASFFIRFKNKEDKKLLFLILSMIIFTTAVNPHNWWARYVPQLWLLPALILLFLNTNYSENKTFNYTKIFLMTITCIAILCNCWIIFNQNTYFNLVYRIKTESFYNHIKSTSNNKGIYIMRDILNNKYYINTELIPFTDVSIIPHLKEKNIKITEVPFDEKKIKEYSTLQPFNYVYRPCYYYKVKSVDIQ